MKFKWINILNGKTLLSENEDKHFERIARCYTHELRSSLTAIQAGVEGMADYVPALIHAYQLSRNAGALELPEIPQLSLDLMLLALNNMQRDIKTMHFFLKTKALCLKGINPAELSMQRCSIKTILDKALVIFFNQSNLEKNCFTILPNFMDFYAEATADILEWLFLIFIDEVCSLVDFSEGISAVQIKSFFDSGKNHLIFNIPKMRISSDQFSHLFEPWTVISGPRRLGIELYFCKKVMNCFNGNLSYIQDHENGFFDFSFPIMNDKKEIV